MKYVLDENENIKIGPNGKPLMVGADGKEFEFDAIGAADKITTVNNEAKRYRKERNEARTAYEPFKDMDATEATKALQVVSTMGDDHKLEIKKVEDTLNTAWQKKFDDSQTQVTTLTDNLFTSNVTNKIEVSKVFEDSSIPTRKMFADTFKGQFNADGSANDWQGNKILSKENPALNAGTDESLSHLLATHTDTNRLTAASGAHGGEHHQSANSGGDPTPVKGVDRIKAGMQSRKNV